MKETLEYLYGGGKLSRTDAEEILLKIGKNSFTEIEISSFLTVFLMRRIEPTELAGFRDALLRLCLPVDLSGFDTIDVCGTGGDGKNTFNISTISSFVLAGAGIKVSKHGNFGVSSPVGSSNILEYFGYRFSNDSTKARNEIESAGITYLHAPLFHPAMKYVAPVRKALRTKTFFNMLGPMINPAFPKYQLVGVYSTEVQSLYDQVYRQSDQQYMILHSLDGYDEISLTGDVKVVTFAREEMVNAATFRFDRVQQKDLNGGETTDDAAAIFMNILNNEAALHQKNVVLANSAAAIRCINPGKDWEECLDMARESLESGKALQSFNRLISMQS